jgi:hypothetical protein
MAAMAFHHQAVWLMIMVQLRLPPLFSSESLPVNFKPSSDCTMPPAESRMKKVDQG